MMRSCAMAIVTVVAGAIAAAPGRCRRASSRSPQPTSGSGLLCCRRRSPSRHGRSRARRRLVAARCLEPVHDRSRTSSAPPQPGRQRCAVIADPTRGFRRRGPVPAGAITAGPEQEASPALSGTGVEGGFAPADLRSAYALPSTTAGSGQTVGDRRRLRRPHRGTDLGVYGPSTKYRRAPPAAAASGR